MTEEEFWAHVDVRGDGDCWVWIGVTYDSGYGHAGWTGYPKRAHRLAWEISNGPIPKGLHVLHKCDNPPCCNPSHLFLGTSKDNRQDAMRKGRVLNEEHRRKIGREHKGMRHTEEAKRKISEAGKGKPKSAEHRRKIGEANSRRGQTEETRRKISEARKRWFIEQRAEHEKVGEDE